MRLTRTSESSLRGWAPLEWGGIDPDTRDVLDRVTITRDDGFLTVTDAPTDVVLMRLEPEELREHSLVSTLVDRLTEFYCGRCREPLEDGCCRHCDVDRRTRLRRTIALLEEED